MEPDSGSGPGPPSRAETATIRRLARRRRRDEALFLVEGIRCAREALRRPLPVRFAVVSPRLGELAGGAELARSLADAGAPLREVGDAELSRLSATESPQGALIVCENEEATLNSIDPAGGVLVSDALRDPGNLGTLMRSAAAFGLGGLVALDGSVDPWGPKTVRAHAGAGFRLPVARSSMDQLVGWASGAEVELIAAEAAGRPVADFEAPPRWALVVGNEAHGVRAALRRRVSLAVSVPMLGGAESLNAAVAGSILMFELSRRSIP